jgi:hypothetical protein
VKAASVSTPLRRHSGANTTAIATWGTPKLHHSQLPARPRTPTSPATYRGVSTEKVVAAMDAPASQPLSWRPAKK